MIKIKFTKRLRRKLKNQGFTTHLKGYHYLSEDSKFELPCAFTGLLSNKIEMGCYSYVGENFKNYLPLRIGRFCSIADDVKIGLYSHPTDRISTSPFFYTHNWLGDWNSEVKEDKIIPFESDLPVEIGDDVWIGANVSIKGGIKIGTGSIIACGAVITKDVKEYSIVGGVPAVVIGERKIQKKFAHKYKPRGYLTAEDFVSFSIRFKRLRRRIKGKIKFWL